jgi:DNA-directed RNA polymerase specialized sigma24 family protein
MARRKRLNIEILRDFRELDREYRENTTDSPAVEALNRLPPDERALMILYIVMGRNMNATANYLHVDRHTIDRYIWFTKIKIETNLIEINKQREKNNEFVF